MFVHFVEALKCNTNFTLVSGGKFVLKSDSTSSCRKVGDESNKQNCSQETE